MISLRRSTMKRSPLASMIASSPVRTHLATYPLSHSLRIENRATYPSMKVSFVLKEVNESLLSYVGSLERKDRSRLFIVGVPQRIRWTMNHQFSRLPWPSVRPVGLEQPRPNTGQKLSGRPQSSDLLVHRSHAYGSSSLSETIALED